MPDIPCITIRVPKSISDPAFKRIQCDLAVEGSAAESDVGRKAQPTPEPKAWGRSCPRGSGFMPDIPCIIVRVPKSISGSAFKRLHCDLIFDGFTRHKSHHIT